MKIKIFCITVALVSCLYQHLEAETNYRNKEDMQKSDEHIKSNNRKVDDMQISDVYVKTGKYPAN